jgi:hypothetical protein
LEVPAMVDAVTADLLSRAQFVIEATVQSLGRSTVPDIPVDDHPVVVKIDRVLHSPTVLARSAGRDVTVQLAAGSLVPAVGVQMTLFTTPIAYGDGMAVAEVGRGTPGTEGESSTMEPGSGGPSRPHPTLDVAQQLEEERLRAHAAAADAVVIGRVTQLEKAGEAALTEHDPDWWVATIAVDHRVKGPVTDTVRFAFPNSTDVRWAWVPKPTAGELGIWLLHASAGDAAALADYSLLDVDDVQRPDELERLGLGGGGQ